MSRAEELLVKIDELSDEQKKVAKVVGGTGLLMGGAAAAKHLLGKAGEASKKAILDSPTGKAIVGGAKDRAKKAAGIE